MGLPETGDNGIYRGIMKLCETVQQGTETIQLCNNGAINFAQSTYPHNINLHQSPIPAPLAASPLPLMCCSVHRRSACQLGDAGAAALALALPSLKALQMLNLT